MYIFICTQDIPPTDKDFILNLYNKYRGLMFFTATKYISSSSVVEDLVQDSIVRLIEKIDTLRTLEHYSLASYIVATVRNICINYLKKQSLMPIEFLDDEYDIMSSMDIPPLSLDDIVLLNERKSQLETIWPLLPLSERFLLEGKYFLGYSDSELAKQLECNPSSIRMKLTRARRHALNMLIKLEGGVFNDKT